MIWKEMNQEEIDLVLRYHKFLKQPIHPNLLRCFSLSCSNPLRLFYERKGSDYRVRFPVVGICQVCGRIHGFGRWRLPRGIVDPDNWKALINFGA